MILSQWHVPLWQALLFLRPISAVVLSTPLSAFSNLQAGDSLPITWADADGDVTLALKSGTPENLRGVEVIASNLPGSSYTWTIPSTLPTDTYAIQIEDASGTTNYSPLFEIQGSESGSSGGSVASSITSLAGGAISTATSAVSGAGSTAGSGGVLDTTTSAAGGALSTATSVVGGAISTATSGAGNSVSTRSSSSSSSSATSAQLPRTGSLASSSSSILDTSFSTSATSTSPSNANTTLSPDPSNSGSGLSTGAKAGIGVGAALGFLIFVALAFWWGRRSAARNKGGLVTSHDDSLGKAELGAEEKTRAELEAGSVVVLSEEEKRELERRRRATELEGREVVSPVEGGWRNERAELEGRREAGRYEIG